MSEHCGYITRIKNVRKMENADRLLVGECFGNTVVVDLSYKEGDLGVYFPVDLQLDSKFCEVMNLVRKKDKDGKNIGGFLEEGKLNIKAIKLRGERSDGLFIHYNDFVEGLKKAGLSIENMNEGATVGEPVCRKYIPKCKYSNNFGNSKKNKKGKARKISFPNFVEHIDTEQLNYNLSAFKAGDLIEITLKMHGTSGRSAITLKEENSTPLAKWFKKKLNIGKKWVDVCGTRRVVLDSFDKNGGWYGNDKFREQHHKRVITGLKKGEEIFYEIVGYVDGNTTIMPVVDNTKTKDKDFVKAYGKTTTFSYGCEVGESKMYVYRMTMTNEDGDCVEYTPDFMRYRCEQMGLNTVPVLWKGYIPEQDVLDSLGVTAGEWIKNVAEQFYDGVDPIGKNHVREGVVVRIVNRPSFAAYKTKNFFFKVLSGIAVAEVSESNANMSEDTLSEI
jgi:hypothetical protein